MIHLALDREARLLCMDAYMAEDYIQLSYRNFEARGRNALAALFGVLAFRLLVTVALVLAAGRFGPEAAVALRALVASFL